MGGLPAIFAAAHLNVCSFFVLQKPSWGGKEEPRQRGVALRAAILPTAFTW